jgi:LysR family transcriptional activator of nhaA
MKEYSLSELSFVQPQLLHWFDRQHILLKIVDEFDDSALMKAFGQAGVGINNRLSVGA